MKITQQDVDNAIMILAIAASTPTDDHAGMYYSDITNELDIASHRLADLAWEHAGCRLSRAGEAEAEALLQCGWLPEGWTL